MRKLTILKSLIDFVWIVTCIPAILLLLFFTVYMFIEPEVLKMVFETEDILLQTSTATVQVLGLLYIIVCFVSIYCVYLFRKTISYFQKVQPFHTYVIDNYYKIGYLLIGIGISFSVLYFLAQLFLTKEFKIHIGWSPYLMLICLGLFFMVLSEVFKVAKHSKEENNLTI